MSEIREDRDPIGTMQTDWDWILKTLTMVRDRAATGTPLHIVRPASVSPTWDIIGLYRAHAIRVVEEIFATAVVDEETKA